MDNQRLTSQPRQWQSYYLTEGQLREIQQRQVNGSMPTVEANNAAPADFNSEVFRSRYAGYRIPAVDAMHYVVALRRRQFDPYTGEDLSDFTVQVYNVETFDALTDRSRFGGEINGFSGLEFHLLHDPTKRALGEN